MLTVRDLSVDFTTDDGVLNVVDRVSFVVDAGEVVGLVGESGCGKSVTALTIMGLLPRPSGSVRGGSVELGGEDLLQLDSDAMQEVRGQRIGMIFQEPMTALNPVHRVGRQLAEVLTMRKSSRKRVQRPEQREDMTRQCLDLLHRVGIPAPEQRLNEYPHQLSGGMRQRVMIAMALAGRPQILIADEPTTALDVTVQAQIIDLLLELRAEYGMAIIFITHDLGVIAEIAERVVVMYAGRIAEEAHTTDLFASPFHPYTHGLINSIPRLESTPKSTLPVIEGIVPSLKDMPSGCRFNNRCARATEACIAEPVLTHKENERRVACHHPL